MTPSSACRRRPAGAGCPVWPRRDGADFGKAEAQAQQDVRHLGILVDPAAMPTGLGKLSPKARTASRLSSRATPIGGANFSSRSVSAMGIFRFERMEERPHQPLERTDHEPSSGTGRRPSISSASGRAQRTAESGSGPYRCGKRSPPREVSHFNSSPSAPASTATRSKSDMPGIVSRQSARKLSPVEKWMNSLRISRRAPEQPPRFRPHATKPSRRSCRSYSQLRPASGARPYRCENMSSRRRMLPMANGPSERRQIIGGLERSGNNS